MKSAFFARRKESSKETRKGGEERVDSDLKNPRRRLFSPSFEPPSLIATKVSYFDKPLPRSAADLPRAFQKSERKDWFPSPMQCSYPLCNA